jgi:acetylornithine deacetylase/succinyl-diaminopimelate desuccinylase-like protein
MSNSAANTVSAIYQRPAELLQNLIRFNTTNPPGNEGDCIVYINHLLQDAGIDTTILALDPTRPNLIARLSGAGNAPPLLLQGHVDVVTIEHETWQQPPFDGNIIDGWVWGRGALDMKGGDAMMIAAILRAKAEGITPPGEVILTLMSDEEAGSKYWAKYLVENHASQFAGARYAIGEFGAFNFTVGKRKFYPIMVAEKPGCGILMTVRGPGGHPTVAHHGGAMAKLGDTLERLEHRHLPVHVTTASRMMIQTMSKSLSFPSNIILRQLLNPKMTDIVLGLLGKQVEQFEPLLHNTVNPTAITEADNPIGIPTRITVHLACILLPGYSVEDIMSELRAIAGENVEFKVSDNTTFYQPVQGEPNMGLFDTLAGILREADPEGVPVPLLVPFQTDGRFFSQLGIQTYGFLPMNFPPDLEFWRLTHGADERIPVEVLSSGTEAIFKLLQRFGK